MCGIAGIVDRSGTVSKASIQKMVQAIAHRGPDDAGVWVDENGVAGFGHARLSIIDLSPRGHQPMHTGDGQLSITFNGEIYNYQTLRDELAQVGHTFMSDSDTEVLLAAYKQWGDQCVERLNGMFSFAIWDAKEQRLFAARDRLGEKPFKYLQDGGRFYFGSEIKALFAASKREQAVDWESVDVALALRYVPSPATGFTTVQKLPAAHTLTWHDGVVTTKRYWHPADTANTKQLRTYDAWKKTLWDTFEDSVKLRMVSDVPVGAFLSGGVDSSSVVAAMAAVANKPINTYVISLDGNSEDQQYAKEVANALGTNHTEIALSDIDVIDAIQRLAIAYDEPFFDQSALPSMLISEQMKKEVTVVLSGDGADELFAGYPAYGLAPTFQRFQHIPQLLRSLVAKSIPSRFSSLKYKAEVLSFDFFDTYLSYVSTWQEELPVSQRYITKRDLYTDTSILDKNLSKTQLQQWFADANRSQLVDQATYADIVGRLADGYMTKVDIASMQHALEVRTPFLDHRLVSLAHHMPSSYKLHKDQGKKIWREIVSDKIPQSVLKRPKRGFSVPLGELLEGAARPLVEDVLLSPSARLHEQIKHDTIARLWKEQLDGRADYSNHIWSLLMLELWLQHYT